MDENLHNIEKLFHDSVERHEEMPAEFVWTNIDHKLDKSNMVLAQIKYNRLRRLSAVLLLLLLGTITYEVLTKTAHPDNKKSIAVYSKDKIELVIPAVAKRNSLKNSKIKQEPISSNPLAVHDQDKTLSGAGTAMLRPDTKGSKSLNNPINNTGLDQKRISSLSSVTDERVAPTNRSTTKNHALKIPEAATGNGRNIAKKNHTIDISGAEEKNQSVKSQLTKASVKVIAYKKLQSIPGELRAASDNYVVEQTNTDPENETKKKSVLISPVHNPENSRLVTIPAVTHFTVRFAVTINEAGSSSSMAYTNAALISIAKKQCQFHFVLTPFFAPQFNFNRIVDNDVHPANSQRRSDVDDIKNGENDKSSYSLGVLIEIPLKKRWFLQTGLAYTNKTVEIQPKKIYADLDNGAIKYRFDFSSGYTYLNPKTATTPVVGDSILATESSSNLQYIAIPLTVNYTFLKGKFNIIPSLGAGVNFLISDKMQTNVLTGTSSEKQNMTSIQGLKKVYFNTITGIAFQYNAGKKIDVNLTPSANFALGPINRTTAIKSYPNSFNIAAGVKIYF